MRRVRSNLVSIGSSSGWDGVWGIGAPKWREGLLPPVFCLAYANGWHLYKQSKMLFDHAFKNNYDSKFLLKKSMAFPRVLTCESLKTADTAKRDDNWCLSHIRPKDIFANVFSIIAITPVAKNVDISIHTKAKHQYLWFWAELLFSVKNNRLFG